MQLPESATGTVANISKTTTTTTSTAIRNTLSKSDPYLIDRLVGYHEYGRALNYLDRLVSMCDRYELEAVDAIVKSEPEFAIYTVAADKQSAKTASAEDQDGRKRHGLKWITALARVELGAMYAGFSQSPRPFGHVPSPGYDAAQFRTLLAESARVHFLALHQDPLFRSLTKKFRANSWTLAYLRRLNIATAFAMAGGQSARREAPRTLAEMSNYAKRLTAARTAIQAQIAAYLVQVRVQQSTSSQTTNGMALTELCNEGVCREFSIAE